MPLPARLQDEAVVHLFYLHGFGSSPDSGKAAYLRERLAPLGLRLHAPDFNQPDFSTLTVSRMIGQVREAIGRLEPGPVALIGSSLGGFVAIHVAAREQGSDAAHQVTHLVLLAPAVDFASGRDGWLTGAQLQEWRRTGRRDVFHYAHGRTYQMHFGLYEDGHGYDAFQTRPDVPVLAFQGVRDTVVKPERVTGWAAARPNVTLRTLDDDHQLQAHMEQIWLESARFLGLAAE